MVLTVHTLRHESLARITYSYLHFFWLTTYIALRRGRMCCRHLVASLGPCMSTQQHGSSLHPGR